MKALSLILSLWCFCLATRNVSSQENWTRFRGPNADGVAQDNPQLPTQWNQNENILWKTDIPGLGWSSPVIWENKVFLTTVTSDGTFENQSQASTMAKGARRSPAESINGLSIAWTEIRGRFSGKKEVHQGTPPVGRHPKNTYASETPCVDEHRVYVLFGDLGLYCFDHGGRALWDVPIEPEETMRDYGAAASPVLEGNRIFVQYDNANASFIAAFETTTGKELWRKPREEKNHLGNPFHLEDGITQRTDYGGSKPHSLL